MVTKGSKPGSDDPDVNTQLKKELSSYQNKKPWQKQVIEEKEDPNAQKQKNILRPKSFPARRQLAIPIQPPQSILKSDRGFNSSSLHATNAISPLDCPATLAAVPLTFWKNVLAMSHR